MTRRDGEVSTMCPLKENNFFSLQHQERAIPPRPNSGRRHASPQGRRRDVDGQREGQGEKVGTGNRVRHQSVVVGQESDGDGESGEDDGDLGEGEEDSVVDGSYSCPPRPPSLQGGSTPQLSRTPALPSPIPVPRSKGRGEEVDVGRGLRAQPLGSRGRKGRRTGPAATSDAEIRGLFEHMRETLQELDVEV